MLTTTSQQQGKKTMSSRVTEAMKAKPPEVYHGYETCRELFALLLADIAMPVGLLTLQDIEECGYVKEIGFVWLKHKQKREHKFENVAVLLDTEVTVYFKRKKIKKHAGVKVKKLLIWISLCEIYVKDDSRNRSSSITYKTPAGLSKSFPISLFESDVDVHGDWQKRRRRRTREGKFVLYKCKRNWKKFNEICKASIVTSFRLSNTSRC